MNILDLPRTDIQTREMHFVMNAVLVPDCLEVLQDTPEIDASMHNVIIAAFMAALPIISALDRLAQLVDYLDKKPVSPIDFNRVLGVLFSMGMTSTPKAVVFSS